MNNRLTPKKKQIYWGVKLHLETTELDTSDQPLIANHDFYRLEGKERPLLIMKDRAPGRSGQSKYNVAYVTSKNLDARGNERKDLVPFSFRQGTASFAEVPTDIPEKLIKRYEAELHEQMFREIKRKLIAIAMQSMMGD